MSVKCVEVRVSKLGKTSCENELVKCEASWEVCEASVICFMYNFIQNDK